MSLGCRELAGLDVGGCFPLVPFPRSPVHCLRVLSREGRLENSSESELLNTQKGKPLFCLGVFVVLLLFVFKEMCLCQEHPLPTVKNSLFLSPFFLFCFSLFLNVATDSKDEELKVPPRRPYLGMYCKTLASFPSVNTSPCTYLISQAASPSMFTHDTLKPTTLLLSAWNI